MGGGGVVVGNKGQRGAAKGIEGHQGASRGIWGASKGGQLGTACLYHHKQTMCYPHSRIADALDQTLLYLVDVGKRSNHRINFCETTKRHIEKPPPFLPSELCVTLSDVVEDRPGCPSQLWYDHILFF